MKKKKNFITSNKKDNSYKKSISQIENVTIPIKDIKIPIKEVKKIKGRDKELIIIDSAILKKFELKYDTGEVLIKMHNKDSLDTVNDSLNKNTKKTHKFKIGGFSFQKKKSLLYRDFLIKENYELKKQIEILEMQNKELIKRNKELENKKKS